MLQVKLARDLWKIRAQVATIALVVASGIAAFCAALSTYESLRTMQAAFYGSARFAHVFATARRVPASLAPRLIEIPGVAEAETTLSFDVLIDLPGVLEPMVGRMIALPEHGLPRINRLTLMAGRWIDAPRSNQVLVNETFAKAHKLVPGSTVSALLNGKRETLRVTGILLSPEYVFAATPGVGDEKGFGIFWIGRERLEGAFDMDGAFNAVALRLGAGASERAVIDAVDTLLGPYGGTGAYGRADQPSHKVLSQEIQQMQVFGIVLPSVFLGVAVFLVNVVVTRQIGTQRAQIAALKALGCPDWRIGGHYLQFVLVIVLIGVAIGTAAGAALGRSLAELYATAFHFPLQQYVLPAWIVLVAAAVSLAGATAGAMRAVLRVVRLPPAEAMRPETPPVYRATLLERIGLGRLAAPGVRMILRDMERRPGRAAFTTLGIAASVAILVGGTWWGDAIDYMLDVELQMRERQHVTVALAEAASTTIEHDLARLPGVLAAEANRTTNVRLYNGHRSYRTTLSGLPERSLLRPLLDADLRRTIDLPPDGIVLGARLAERLGVRPGDPIRVELLQHGRVSRVVPVAGIVSESMGMQAFTRRAALNRLIGDGDAVNAARLQIDPAQRGAFLRQVKETPRLAMAIELGPIIRNFREVSGKNILYFTTVLSVLGATIAIGVVYNNARITLAERAWDLSSLRVLGFTRREVSTLLLGELAIELLAALPLGWVLGYGLSWLLVQLMQTEEFTIPLVIQPSTYAYASLVMLAAGVVSGLIVRSRIDRLDLVAVLKTRDA